MSNYGSSSSPPNTSAAAAAHEDVTENTPLLSTDGDLTSSPLSADNSVDSDNDSIFEIEAGHAITPDDPLDKPLPVGQIVLLCFARFVEPVAFFSIFPYINVMVQENGHLEYKDVGFYSGLIESLFSLTQMCVMVAWGRAADRFGRKPVLVFSLAGVSASLSIFGMASTLWEMMLYRCLAGVFAGTVVTLRTMISEQSTAKTQARAFSWFSFSGNIGILLGPLIGGVLVEPAKQYPNVFGKIQFFVDYPYALPSFAVGLLGIVATVLCVLFVEETMPPKSSNHDTDIEKPVPPKTRELLRIPGVGLVLATYTHIMLLAIVYTAVIPVFWFTPVALGGLGFSPFQISLMMALNGLAQAIWILFVFPPFHARVGTNGVLRACAIAYPFFFAGTPLANVLLRCGADALFWAIYPAFLALGVGVSMCFTAIQLAINDVSPAPEVLGTLNALALATVSGVRSFSPALFSGLFSFGVGTQWLGGYAIWVLMVAVASGFTALSKVLPDYDALRIRREMGQDVEEEDEDDDELVN